MDDFMSWFLLVLVCFNVFMSLFPKDMATKCHYLLWAALLLLAPIADDLVFGAVK